MSQDQLAFDRGLDERVNGVKARDLHAYGVPVYWIAVSPIECQALQDGVISTAILTQVAMLLKPGVGE